MDRAPTARELRRKLGPRKTRKHDRCKRTKLQHVFAQAKKRGERK